MPTIRDQKTASIQQFLHYAYPISAPPESLKSGGILETESDGTLPCQHLHIVPEITVRLAAREGGRVLADHLAVLADDDAIAIGRDVDRPAHRLGHHRVSIVVETIRQVFDTEAGTSKRPT